MRGAGRVLPGRTGSAAPTGAVPRAVRAARGERGTRTGTGMDERKDGGRVSGRRRTGLLLSRRGAADLGVGGFEERFGAALRVYDADPEAERRAVAAFRGARAAGLRPSRTRPRDDWRPTARRRRALEAVRAVLRYGTTRKAGKPGKSDGSSKVNDGKK